MKEKTFIFILILVSLGFSTAYGQYSTADNDADVDSTINVIAWFNKNDTMKYERTISKFTVENGDTTKKKISTQEEFMIVVTDSTAKGYTMEYIPIRIAGEDIMEKDSSANKIMSGFIEQFKDQRVTFTTDEYGSIKSIKNWKEIRDKVKKGTKAMLDSLYKQENGLDSVMPRNRFESLINLKFSTEQGILSSYDELQKLFSLHGNSFPIGTTRVDEQEKDSSYTVVSVGYAKYDDQSFDDDYNISGRTVQKFTAEETLSLIGNVFGMLLTDSLSSEFNKVAADSLDGGMTITNLEDYYIFYNGWPCMMRTQKITEIEDRQDVTTDEIEWTWRYWQYELTKREEPDAKSM